MKPVLSVLNWPLREYEMAPLALLISKKPPPLMATSSGLSVVVMVPCVNCCATVATCVPMPIAPLGPPIAFAYRSANSARDVLAP